MSSDVAGCGEDAEDACYDFGGFSIKMFHHVTCSDHVIEGFHLRGDVACKDEFSDGFSEGCEDENEAYAEGFFGHAYSGCATDEGCEDGGGHYGGCVVFLAYCKFFHGLDFAAFVDTNEQNKD